MAKPVEQNTVKKSLKKTQSSYNEVLIHLDRDNLLLILVLYITTKNFKWNNKDAVDFQL